MRWEQKCLVRIKQFYFSFYFNILQKIQKNVFKCDMYLFKGKIKLKKKNEVFL